VKDEMARACGMHGENRNAYRVLVGNLEEQNNAQD
jgi:hypothetical protein